ncbi:hypothetical protein Tco_0960244, partial [Tanacetum coccineum]
DAQLMRYLPSMNLEVVYSVKMENAGLIFAEAIKRHGLLNTITGWSVIHSVQLVRNGEGAKYSMLGELLKAKSA